MRPGQRISELKLDSMFLQPNLFSAKVIFRHAYNVANAKKTLSLGEIDALLRIQAIPKYGVNLKVVL